MILHDDWSNRPRTAFRRWTQAVHQVAAIQVGRHRFLACPYRFLAAKRQAKAGLSSGHSHYRMPSNPSPLSTRDGAQLTFRNNQIQILQTSSTLGTTQPWQPTLQSGKESVQLPAVHHCCGANRGRIVSLQSIYSSPFINLSPFFVTMDPNEKACLLLLDETYSSQAPCSPLFALSCTSIHGPLYILQAFSRQVLKCCLLSYTLVGIRGRVLYVV